MADVQLEIIDQQGTRYLPFDGERLTIGRRSDSTLQLAGNDISRQHAEIVERDGRHVLRDLGSRFGTFVNGEQIQERQLIHGDRIRLGKSDEVRLRYVEGAAPTAPSTRATGTTSAVDLRPLTHLLKGLQAIGSGGVLEEVLAVVLDSAIDMTGAERGFVMLAVDGELEFKLARAQGGTTLPAEEMSGISRQVPQQTFTSAETQVISDFQDPSLAQGHDRTIAFGIRYALCTPLRLVQFTETARKAPEKPVIIGVLYLDSRTPGSLLSDPMRDALETLAGEAAVAIENARLYRSSLEKAKQDQELENARRMQRDILPPRTHESGRFALAGESLACRAVGGDFLHYAELDDGGLAFSLGDVSGKGPPAALLAVRTHAIIDSLAETLSSPALLAQRTNRSLLKRPIEARFVTVFFGLVSAEGELTWCNAGHNPPVLLRADGSTELLETGGLMLGIFPEAEFEEGTTRLSPGDTLVVFSDGVTEADRADGEQFGDDRLLETLAACDRNQPVAVLEKIQAEVTAFAAGHPQADDVTVLVLRYGES